MWSGSRFIMFGAVRLRAVRTAWYELFVHSERIRAATQGVCMLNSCHIFMLFWYQLKYITNVLAVRETARYNAHTVYSYSHFGTNPLHLIIWNVAEPSQMKCCGSVLEWNYWIAVQKRNRKQSLKNWLFVEQPSMNLSPMEQVWTTPFC